MTPKRQKNKNSKLKYEHRMIQGLRNFLESEIALLEDVSKIIPGRISRSSGSMSKLGFRAQYQTASGVKCIARSNGWVQEVFLVTSNPNSLLKQLELICANPKKSPGNSR